MWPINGKKNISISSNNMYDELGKETLHDKSIA